MPQLHVFALVLFDPLFEPRLSHAQFTRNLREAGAIRTSFSRLFFNVSGIAAVLPEPGAKPLLLKADG